MQANQSSQDFQTHFDMSHEQEQAPTSPKGVKSMWKEHSFTDVEYVDVMHFIVEQQDPTEGSKKNVYCKQCKLYFTAKISKIGKKINKQQLNQHLRSHHLHKDDNPVLKPAQSTIPFVYKSQMYRKLRVALVESMIKNFMPFSSANYAAVQQAFALLECVPPSR